jgi:hypothetical protein
MIALFKKKYELHCGLEYFKGNRFEMIKDICRFILEEDEPEIFFEEVVQYWFEDVGDIASLNNNEVVMNDEEKSKIDEKKVAMVVATSLKPHYCTPCGLSSTSKCNFMRHCTTKKHIDKIENPDVVLEGEFKCKNCVKTYKSNPGLWAHNKKCKPATVIVAIPEIDLPAKIDNLKVIIQKLSKILHVNDADITEENIDEPIVSIMNDEVVLLDGNKSPFICVPCGHPCKSKSNLTKHQTSKKHKDKIENPDAVVEIVTRFIKVTLVYGLTIRSVNQPLWYWKSQNQIYTQRLTI